MNLLELFFESFGTLSINKMRTGLAVLGIVIGIGSVIALVSLGQSSQKAVQSQIQSLGANLLTVNPSGQNSGSVRGAAGGGTTLTLDDAQALMSSTDVTTVKSIAPVYSARSQVVTGKNNTNTQVMGVTANYATVRKVTISSGKFITDKDVSANAKVAVIGPTVVEDLFGENANPIGQTIRVNGKTLTIIGVTKSKGTTGFQNQDDIVYVPLSTAQKQIFGVKHLSSLYAEATSQDVMTKAQNQIGYFLMARHKITDTSKIDFRIQSQQDILDTASSVTGTFTTLLSGVAAISLLVGGIGIMNIMLVTVTERTREIGLRKALGARDRIIISQFLIEAVIITMTGGILGIVLGIGASYAYSAYSGSVFSISLESVGLAFVVSAAIGIVFGWYPARKASNLEPIEALRYE